MGVGAVGGSVAMGGAAMGGATGMTGASLSGGAEGVTNLSGQIDTNSMGAPTSIQEALAGQIRPGLEQLNDLMGDESFSKVLFTLIMLQAMEKDDKKSTGGSGTIAGLMAGMAFASQFGRNSQCDLKSPAQNVGNEGNAGANLNLTA